ncbi:MAG: hypothetical protein ACKO41_05740 [Sphingomonadales bacterium]
MRQTLLIGVVLLWGVAALAQPNYFIYLQSEPTQSFSVSIKEQTLLSSHSGYIIIPNLTDSILQIVVGFPEKKYPDHSFIINTKQSDQGYLLKDYGDKGWGLLDWRMLSITYAARPDPVRPLRSDTPGQTDFATMLAKASGDSSLLTQTPAAKQKNEIKPAIITKVDTVMVSKPVEAPRAAEEQRPSVEKKAAAIAIPSYCKSILTEPEFKECLDKVQPARSEISKVNVLREFLSGRCYTIEQVRTLALLLTTDEVKYDFLLEAWTHTVERPRYLTLVSVFSSAATGDRFKEMFQ